MSNEFYSKDLHCIAPFSSLVLLLSDAVQPCCNWLADDNYKINTKIDPTQSVNDLFENTNSKIRMLFMKKEHTKYQVCKKCFEGNQSQYISHNKAAKEQPRNFVVNPLLTNLHIQPSNFCNLACRMCTPINSNLLAREKNANDTNDKRFNSSKKFEIKNVSEHTPLFESILKQLEFVNTLWFSGGEPLINQEVWSILEYAVQQGYNNNISLKFNTNGTLSLSQEKRKILQTFKKVEMDISMDGVDAVAEYIRTNLNFNEWVENFKNYRKLFPNLILAHTLSVFNIHLYDEFLDYFCDFDIPISLNFCYYPLEISPRSLSEHAKDYVIEKYKKSKYLNNPQILSIIEFLNINRQAMLPSNAISNYVDAQDTNAIKQNLYKNYRPYREIQPEWFEYLKL